MFGALWSEHCGYKHSKPLLRLLPNTGPRVLTSMGGENAGAIDIGDGLCVVMKVESHNHPSVVEPYQGAATGVGGIVRDIFAMGARPIAILDSLRFGPLSERHNRYLFGGVVGGHRRLRQLPGHPHRGRRGELRRLLLRQPAGERHVRGLRPHRPPGAGPRRGSRQPAAAGGGRHRPRRHRRRQRPRLPRLRRRQRRAAAHGAGGQPLPGEAPHGGLRRPGREPPRLVRRHPGPGGGRPHQLQHRGRCPRRHRPGDRHLARAPARGGDERLRGDALRVPGTHAHHPPPRAPRRRARPLRALGAALRHHRRGDGRRPGAHPRRRPGGGLPAGRRARGPAGVPAPRPGAGLPGRVSRPSTPRRCPTCRTCRSAGFWRASTCRRPLPASRRRRRPSGGCWPARRSPASAGSGASTTTRSSPTR